MMRSYKKLPSFYHSLLGSALEAQLEEQVTLDNIIFWMHKCKLCGCATHEEQPTNHQVFCVNRRVLFIIFLSKLSQYKTVTQGVLLCLLSHAGIRQQTFNQLFATYMCFTFHNSTTLLIQCMVCARVPSMSMTSHLISRAQGRTTSLLIKLNETEVRWRAERHDSREPSGVSGIEFPRTLSSACTRAVKPCRSDGSNRTDSWWFNWQRWH